MFYLEMRRYNHPDTRVFEGSVNPFLERAQAMYHGREKRAPDMPMPGDVDIIFGGTSLNSADPCFVKFIPIINRAPMSKFQQGK
jgi:hypothetical protein